MYHSMELKARPASTCVRIDTVFFELKSCVSNDNKHVKKTTQEQAEQLYKSDLQA